MALQSSVSGAFTCSSLPSHKTSLKPRINATVIMNPKRTKPISRNQTLTALAAPEALADEASAEIVSVIPEETERVRVVVKPGEKPRLVLKFIWMEKNIGLALDQMIPGQGTIPLSPYFFWPRKDAWEELKTTLEGKPWISQKKMIILLNQATDIINLWQQSGGNITT